MQFVQLLPETTLLYRTIQEHWATFLADGPEAVGWREKRR